MEGHIGVVDGGDNDHIEVEGARAMAPSFFKMFLLIELRFD